MITPACSCFADLGNGVTDTWFTVLGEAISGRRHPILLGGGLFLLAKATHERFATVWKGREKKRRVGASGGNALITILNSRSRCWILCSRWIPSSPPSDWYPTSVSWRWPSRRHQSASCWASGPSVARSMRTLP